mmetsp:Transcript_15854/g.43247  ORF Transcript_15854/g.43247 Transcript_15854/m.43247 type:complete len:93 (-) Transcript_15854:180-458(-)|eukprot:CAMPEP_0194504346 /NCGR_PEP_ID=MMETSP0253-20130528/28892_1 /TAXON_ID=2966 /ORGANISM="Noctiluca scintillans" /LENGTH=92 /DNA_ID=CAMNT_0039346721 /DNA_START=44 /DNA_END=322 /DNA_ORIENTATION=-
MTSVLKRLPIGGRVSVFKTEKVYRPGSALSSGAFIVASPVSSALAGAKRNVNFLEVETLKGVPVNKSLTVQSIDPYFAAYIRDFDKVFFSNE